MKGYTSFVPIKTFCKCKVEVGGNKYLIFVMWINKKHVDDI